MLGAEAVKDTIDVHVVDSRFVTAAQGLLALEAATLAESGANPADVASHTAARVADADLVGTIDTMDHLVKSGRLSGAKALFGSMLSVKPILTVRDGLVVEGGRQRTRARALEHLATRTESAAPFDWLAVGGGDANDLDVVVERLKGIDIAHPMIVTEIGPVVGTHGGPGVVGVCWLTRSPSEPALDDDHHRPRLGSSAWRDQDPARREGPRPRGPRDVGDRPVVDTVHDKVIRPILLVAPLVAFSFIIVFASSSSLVALGVALLRILDVYVFAAHQWASWALLGVISLGRGLVHLALAPHGADQSAGRP